MRGLGLALALGVSVVGCDDASSEPTPAGSSGAEDDDGGTGSDGTTAAESGADADGDATRTGGDDTTPDPDTGADETGGCGGCLDDAGACQPGTVDDACGALGDTCVPCEDGTVCAEGECLAPPACGPDNCDGCCDGDECLDGASEAACGQGGGQCSSCPDGSACDAGVCEVPCELSCDGCCTEDDVCVGADEQSSGACGLGASACVDCGADSTCSDGACVSAACAESCDGCCDGDTCLDGTQDDACGTDGGSCSPCGPNLFCGSTGCLVELDAEWDVIAHQAVIAPTDPDGDTWDAFNGLPDPYVVMAVPGQSGETSVIDNELFPEWDEVVLAGITTTQLQAGLELGVRDSDFGFDTTLGGSTAVLEITDADYNELLLVTGSVDGVEVYTVFFSIVPAAG